MSFLDCLSDAVSEIEDAKKRENARLWTDYAQTVWKKTSDQYERQGYSRHNAEAMAATDARVKSDCHRGLNGAIS